ncbi:TetR/AcrR family transcriptional regulator [Actinomadura yumaensis]|uniref:TetR/AcrR family transcriptional regulator n=1 Tax=Actinomadura yumaensis TaxID=111807 RepID=A0ABW2CND5_9ACTN
MERRPRADARRNRERILQAALEAFAAEGELVPLDEIARRAGVGAGTVYRHFTTKEKLFQAVIEDRIGRIVEEARALASSDEPGQAFYGYLEWVVERAMFNHALCEGLGQAGHGRRFQDEFDAALAVILRRAQEAGAVRRDLDVDDVRALLNGCMLMERQRRTTGPPGRMTALAFTALHPPVTKPTPPHNETRDETARRCETCGTPLTPAPTGRPPRFCGPTCRQKAHRRRSPRS